MLTIYSFKETISTEVLVNGLSRLQNLVYLDYLRLVAIPNLIPGIC